MNETTPAPRTGRWTATIVVLLCVVILLQIGLLLQRRGNRLDTSINRPPAPATIWSQADQIETMHAHINRLFDQAFNAPLTAPQPPVAVSNPPSTSSGGAVFSGEGAYDDPFARMRRMQRHIDAMFANTLNDISAPPPGFDEGWTRLEITPGFNIRDTETAYEVTVNLPGVDKSDIRVTLDQSVMGISAEQHLETATITSRGTPVGHSRQTTRFERRLRLPGAVGNPAEVRADYTNNLLRIIVPKQQGTPQQPNPIQVQ